MRNLLSIVAAFGMTVALLYPATVAADAAQSAQPDAAVPIRGTVVSVNNADHTVILRYAPPGSQPATKRTFRLLNHNDALKLRAGQVIDGTADETSTVWVLSNVNIETNRAPHGDYGP